jgi:hypothetical protein
MGLATVVSYAIQESKHQGIQGIEPELQQEHLRDMLTDAVDMYIVLRPAIQGALERCNREFAGLHLEREMLTLQQRQDSLAYERNRQQLAMCRESLCEQFDALLKLEEARGTIHAQEGAGAQFAHLWAAEIVRNLLLREAEAPFGLPVLNETQLRREREIVLLRLMEDSGAEQ